MNEWERLKTWRATKSLRDVPDTPGVYAVRSMKRGKPRVIGRAFGKDKSGILCFGRAGDRGLKKRLTDFCSAASEGRAPHAEGKTYRRLGYYDANRYPLASLEVAWLPLSTQEEAAQREVDWFGAYERIFGELPPLNKKCG